MPNALLGELSFTSTWSVRLDGMFPYLTPLCSVIYHRFSILDALLPDSDTLDDHDDGDSLETASVIITSSGRPPSAILGTRVSKYESYRQRLEPLIELEERLIRLLSSPDEDEATHLGPVKPYSNYYRTENAAVSGKPSNTGPNGRPAPTITIPQKRQTPMVPNRPVGGHAISPSTSNHSIKGKEIAVHTSMNWKKAFSLGNKSKSPKSAHTGEIEGWWEDPEDPVHTLNACAPTMLEMWRDPQVKTRLEEKRLRLEESSGL